MAVWNQILFLFVVLICGKDGLEDGKYISFVVNSDLK